MVPGRDVFARFDELVLRDYLLSLLVMLFVVHESFKDGLVFPLLVLEEDLVVFIVQEV